MTVNTAAEDSDSLRELLASEKSYLEKRTEFWRQQKPIYAIHNERARNLGLTTTRLVPGATATTTDNSGELSREDIWRGQDDIEHLLNDKRPDEALHHARDLRERVEESTIPNRTHCLAMMSSLVGNALFDLAEFAQALTE